MRLALVTDAWTPQVNGVVVTIEELVARLRRRDHEVTLIEPSGFRRVRCPGYPEIEIAWRCRAEVARRLDALRPDAIHIATEGPLGAAARAHALRHGLAFTTAFHTRFPDILAQALGIPARWGYAWFRRFHAPATRVMVPTEGMLGILRERGFRNACRWSHGVDTEWFRPVPPLEVDWPRPVFLYLGRVSYEKNLEAFLALDLPGTKVVYGTGPRLEALRAAHPEVVWRGIVSRTELPAVYCMADVLVFPSRSDTFGLVMAEAMACGTPVAAYPVPGPLDVVGDSGAGVLHHDLGVAALSALRIPAATARAHAATFDWERVCDQFESMLVPASRPRTRWAAA